MKRIKICALFLCLLLLSGALFGCTKEPSKDQQSTDVPTEIDGILFFEGRRYTYEGETDRISVQNDIFTIKKGGTYRLSGELSEGCVCVDAGAAEVVRLILDGLSLASSHTAPLRFERAACVIIELSRNSVNMIEDSPREKNDASLSLPSSALLSYCDLFLCGEGRLVISGQNESALACRTNFCLESGALTLSAKHSALWVRDRFTLENGMLTVTSGEYGIVTDDREGALGEIEISGGHLTVSVTDTALSAGRSIEVLGGSASLGSPTYYRCEHSQNGTTVKGTVRIDATDFPKNS